jgi:antitoxin component YwqK of YwqJK toxin-antitoxin module
MKKIIFSLLILLIPAILFAEVVRKTIKAPDGKLVAVYYSNGKEIAREILDKDGNIIKRIGKIPDGIVKEYHKNGKLRREDNYKDGKLDGICKTYHENGKLWIEWNYKDGKLMNAICKIYYENGKLWVEWNYKDGKRNGISKEYYKNGKLKNEWNYKDGKLNGITKVYYKNGKLWSEANFKNGKVINIRTYGPNGMPIDERWELIELSSEGLYWYIDTKTISHLPGDIVRVWMMGIPKEGSKPFLETQRFLKEMGKDYNAYGYREDLLEINCSESMFRILETIYRSKDGDVLYSGSNPSKWNFIPPSTPAEAIQKAVCKKKKSK